MKVWLLAGALALCVMGCGSTESDEHPPGSGGSSAGSSNSAGGSNHAGGSSGAGSVNAKPTGPVYSCFGKCPLEECDNGMFWADVACSDVYPGPAESSAFCAIGASGGYCLQIGTDELGFDNQRYAVNCASGVSSIAACDSGCGITGTQPAECL